MYLTQGLISWKKNNIDFEESSSINIPSEKKKMLPGDMKANNAALKSLPPGSACWSFENRRLLTNLGLLLSAITKSHSIFYELCFELHTDLESAVSSSKSLVGQAAADSCRAAKYCMNSQKVVLYSSVEPKVSKGEIGKKFNEKQIQNTLYAPGITIIYCRLYKLFFPLKVKLYTGVPSVQWNDGTPLHRVRSPVTQQFSRW